MRRFLSSIFIVLGLLMVAVPTASAATSTKVIRVTERQLNAGLRTIGVIQGASSFSVLIANGTFTLKWTQIEGGQPVQVEMSISSAVANGQAGWWVSSMRLNGGEVPAEAIKQVGIQRPDLFAGLNDGFNKFLEFYTSKYPTYTLTSITLENHVMTITLTLGGAAPALSAAGPLGTALTDCTVTTTTALKLRAQPKSNGTVITIVPIKTQLAATSRLGNWVFVNFQGSTGWLSVSFLRTTGKCK